MTSLTRSPLRKVSKSSFLSNIVSHRRPAHQKWWAVVYVNKLHTRKKENNMANLPKFLKTRKWIRSLIQEDGDVEYCEDGEFWPACEEVKVTIDVEITETIKHVRQYEAYMPISQITGETIYQFNDAIKGYADAETKDSMWDMVWNRAHDYVRGYARLESGNSTQLETHSGAFQLFRNENCVSDYSETTETDLECVNISFLDTSEIKSNLSDFLLI